MKKSCSILLLVVCLLAFVMSCDQPTVPETFVPAWPQTMNTVQLNLTGDVPNWIDEDDITNSFFGMGKGLVDLAKEMGAESLKDVVIEEANLGDITIGKNKISATRGISVTADQWSNLLNGFNSSVAPLDTIGITCTLENTAKGVVSVNVDIEAEYVRVKEIKIVNFESLMGDPSLTLETIADTYIDMLDTEEEINTLLSEMFDPTDSPITAAQLSEIASELSDVVTKLVPRLEFENDSVKFVGSAGGLDIPLDLLFENIPELENILEIDKTTLTITLPTPPSSI